MNHAGGGVPSARHWRAISRRTSGERRDRMDGFRPSPSIMASAGCGRSSLVFSTACMLPRYGRQVTGMLCDTTPPTPHESAPPSVLLSWMFAIKVTLPADAHT